MLCSPVPAANVRKRELCLIAAACLLLPGCSETVPPAEGPAQSATAEPVSGPATREPPPTVGSASAVPESGTDSSESFEFKPLALNALAENAAPSQSSGTGTAEDRSRRIRQIISRMQPLQVLLGQWRGTTRREYENFKAVDSHEWVWDLRTHPEQPALVLTSDKSPYLRSARLSWSESAERFVLQATDASGVTREFAGEFSEAPHDIVGSDDKLHRIFRLELNEVQKDSSAGGSAKDELWQLAIVQQENNRYLLEVAKRRGSADFARFDTVSTQRDGTSFALSDSGYGEKTCIISEGLGTIEVTWQGRSYWVCCSGCRAAFEEDPETWIARSRTKSR